MRWIIGQYPFKNTQKCGIESKDLSAVPAYTAIAYNNKVFDPGDSVA
jgi:hypothetical protein